MNILVTPENAAKIEAALSSVLGRASAHTHDVCDILQTAAALDAQLRKARKMSKRPKSIYRGTSGAPVAKSYKYRRTGSRVTLIGSRRGWYLVAVEAVCLWPKDGGAESLRLAG